MDNVIRDSSIPSGSVILAYGAPSPRSRSPKILALLAGIFGLLIVIGSVVGFLSSHAWLPNNTAVIAYVTASAKLPDFVPQEWIAAQKTSRPFPSFVGLRKTEDGALLPFAIVPRWTKGVSSHTTIFWKTLGADDAGVESKTVSDLALRSTDYLGGSWLLVTPSSLLADSGDAPIGGQLQKKRWETNVRIEKPKRDTRSFVGDSYLDLRVVPGAWTTLAQSLAALELRPTEEMNADVIRWTHGVTGTALALDFAEPMTSSTQISVAAAFGLYDEEALTLADGSTIIEHREPVRLLASSTSNEWKLDDGSTLRLLPNEVRYETGVAAWNETRLPDSCPGRLTAAFRLDLPGLPSTVFFVEDRGEMVACW
jgi:hypothetical protein